MARSNKFINKQVVVNDKSKSLGSITFDDLPIFEPDENGIHSTNIIKGNGKKSVIEFNCVAIEYDMNISVRARRGKLFPSFFIPLNQYNKDMAIEFARVLLFHCKSKKYHSNIIVPYNLFAKYLIKNEINNLSEVTTYDFSQVVNMITHSKPQPIFKYIKAFFTSLPSIPLAIKNDIKDEVFSSKKSIKPVKTLKERVADSTLNSDYSDYVMFQIYAYVSACLSEIEETVTQTETFIGSSNYHSFFMEGGKEQYVSYIQEGDPESLNKALFIELADIYRSNIAIDLLKQELCDEFWNKFISDINNSNYDNIFSASWPLHVKKSTHVQFLCSKVIPIALRDSKCHKKSFIKQIQKVSELSIDCLYKSQSYIFRRAEVIEKFRKFQLHKQSNYFIYSSFYIISNTGNQTGSPLGKIVLGRTLHFDFLLMLLLSAESGRNKEVISSIPNQLEGTSILKNDDIFSSEKSAELIGFKKRGHVNRGSVQPESFSLPHQTPLFRLLVLFDKIRSTQHKSRDYFLSDIEEYYKNWAVSFSKNNQIKQKNGTLVGPIAVSKFRKVFAGEMLNNWLENIRHKDDLIKAVANDLQNSIPLTYLLQSSSTETMLATAIVGLQQKFIDHHQKVAASLKVNGEKPKHDREQRFLCDCIDPTNPDYADNLNVQFCKQFDNCLGCSKAEVYEEHLPNIIYRCFQYEEILNISRDLYDAHFVIKHERAKQVIEMFIEKSSGGQKIHFNACNIAASAWEDPNKYLLPPLLHDNA